MIPWPESVLIGVTGFAAGVGIGFLTGFALWHPAAQPPNPTPEPMTCETVHAERWDTGESVLQVCKPREETP